MQQDAAPNGKALLHSAVPPPLLLLKFFWKRFRFAGCQDSCLISHTSASALSLPYPLLTGSLAQPLASSVLNKPQMLTLTHTHTYFQTLFTSILYNCYIILLPPMPTWFLNIRLPEKFSLILKNFIFQVCIPVSWIFPSFETVTQYFFRLRDSPCHGVIFHSLTFLYCVLQWSKPPLHPFWTHSSSFHCWHSSLSLWFHQFCSFNWILRSADDQTHFPLHCSTEAWQSHPPHLASDQHSSCFPAETANLTFSILQHNLLSSFLPKIVCRVYLQHLLTTSNHKLLTELEKS